MPMPVFTFLERFDFTGKTIKPFCTHEGSGLGRSEADLRRLVSRGQDRQGAGHPGQRRRRSPRDALKRWCAAQP